MHIFTNIQQIAVAVALVSLQSQGQTRTPSTPEERAKAVRIARALESAPLSKEAKEQRNWIVHWLIDVPDISVKVCANLLGPVLESKKNYAPEIFTQLAPSAAAFVVENPDKAKDDEAVYTAALNGALRTYEAILKEKPKAIWPFLDDLIDKRNKGELSEFVRRTSVHCK